MLCERCQKRKATFIYRERSGGTVRQLQLCNSCCEVMTRAGELEEVSAPMAGFASPLWGEEPEGVLPFPLEKSKANQMQEEGSCGGCGMSWPEIVRTGRLGCGACYTAFSSHIGDVLRALHGRATHAGRTAACLRERRAREALLRTRRHELKDAVLAERYEEAATLRDEIRRLEACLEGEETGGTGLSGASGTSKKLDTATPAIRLPAAKEVHTS